MLVVMVDVRPSSESSVFADLSEWRAIEVSGTEATEWLNDLVSADIASLEPGSSRRSLLLSPTGRLRAEFTIARHRPSALLLLQDPGQPSAIDRLLVPYILSSHVELRDRSKERRLFAFPETDDLPPGLPGTALRPSCLGSGMDLIVPANEVASALTQIGERFSKLSPGELEARRVARGIPRLGVDALEDDLPQEAGMESAVSFDKGCYLGQEAVAKVRNLGHPRRLLIRIDTAAPLARGDSIFVNGDEAGRVTSAVRFDGRTTGLATVRWAAREGPFQTKEGAELEARPLP